VVQPQKVSRTRAPLKKNPLRNLGALLKLNPYAKAARRAELLAATKRAEAKAKRLEAARKERSGVKKVSKAFYNTMTTESGGCRAGGDARVRWGGGAAGRGRLPGPDALLVPRFDASRCPVQGRLLRGADVPWLVPPIELLAAARSALC
jgi:hypothetical protein